MTSSGASHDYINLLPDPASDDAWTTYVPTVEDIGDDPIFAFDGQTTAVEIPRSVLDPDTIGTSFTLSTWMKHERQGNEGKQQIVCAADGEGMKLASHITHLTIFIIIIIIIIIGFVVRRYTQSV